MDYIRQKESYSTTYVALNIIVKYVIFAYKF